MAIFSWLRFEEFLAITKMEFDDYIKKIEKWDKEAEKMSQSVRDIWSREKNSMKAKIDDFIFEYHRMLGLKGAGFLDKDMEKYRREIRRDLSNLRGAYYRATSYLRSADKDAGRKETEAQKRKDRPGRYAGISI